jgi:group I intron endonuclease
MTKQCGIYILRNKINKKEYIGSSKNIKERIRHHFDVANERATKYDHPLYKDICLFGKENFEWNILEICEEKELISNEQYWYDLVKPKYNIIRPLEKVFQNKDVQKRAYNKRKLNNSYSTVAVETTSEPILKFNSIADSARYIINLKLSKGTQKTVEAKIKMVCQGYGKTAYGFAWKYSGSVETIPKGSTPTISTLVEAEN